MRLLHILFCLWFSDTATAGVSGVVLSEVMADPVSESTGEYVELFNSGADSVDVGGWMLADRGDVNDVITDYRGAFDMGLSGTVIPPGAYALIVDPDYAGEYDTILREQADASLLLILTIQGDRTLGNGLGNTGDEVILDNGSGYVVRFSWSRSAGREGVSWEKKNPEDGDEETNWSPSISSSGGTPGYANSVTPSARDVGFIPEEPLLTVDGLQEGSPALLRARFRNEGREKADRISLQATVINPWLPAPGFEGSPIRYDAGKSLDPGETGEIPLLWRPESGGKKIIHLELIMSEDGNRSNNERFDTLTVGYLPRSLVVNEIMFDPGPDGPEWLELFNRRDGPVDLGGWSISGGDTAVPRLITPESLIIPPQDYLVLAQDEEAFHRQYPDRSVPVLRPYGGWTALRNSGGAVILKDGSGQIVERLVYSPLWSREQGRSAERLNADSDIWGPSASLDGGTPGAVNGLFAEHLPTKWRISLTPNPFSPDNNGREDRIVITFELPVPRAIMRVWLYDITGRRVKTLMDSQPVGSRWAVEWDGLDDRGRPLETGPYILYAEGFEETGTVMSVLREIVVIVR